MLLLIENGKLREAADAAEQPWFRLYHFIGSWRPELDMDGFALNGKVLAAQPRGFDRQLDAVGALCPPNVLRGTWDLVVEDRWAVHMADGHALLFSCTWCHVSLAAMHK